MDLNRISLRFDRLVQPLRNELAERRGISAVTLFLDMLAEVASPEVIEAFVQAVTEEVRE